MPPSSPVWPLSAASLPALAVGAAQPDPQSRPYQPVFLSTVAPGPDQNRLALAMIALSIAMFAAAAPLARLPLAPLPAFTGVHAAALMVIDLITALLLLGTVSGLGQRKRILTCGYLYAALMTIPYALAFPGLFSPTGLLGAGSQTSAWLTLFAHGGFPPFVIAYAALDRGAARGGHQRNRLWTCHAAAAAAALAIALTLLAIRGGAALPPILAGDRYTREHGFVAAAVVGIGLAAVLVLARPRRRSVLDRWLLVVMTAQLLSFTLCEVLNSGRFDLGFYAGRLYGLLAAALLLAVLLLEASRLNRRLIAATARLAEDAEQLEANVRARTAALRESERRFQDIAEGSGDWIWETDREHRFTVLSGQSRDALFIPPEGVLGRTRWDLAGGDPAADAKWARHKADLDGHRPFRHFHYGIDAPHGRRRFVVSSGKPVFDEHQNFLGYRGLGTDETEAVETRHRAERAEALLRDAIESISEGFAIYDEETRLVVCNTSYQTLFRETGVDIAPGMRFEDIIRAGLAKGVYPDAVGREAEWLAERLREDHDPEGPVEHRLGDGRWVLVTKHRMSNGWIAGLRIDITALKAAQAALELSEQHLKRAQRIAHMGSDIRDLRTGESVWSDESYRIFGVARETFVPSSANFLAMVHPDDRAAIVEKREEVNRSSGPVSMEYRIIRPDGSVRHIYREAEVIRDADGNPLYRTGIIHDVTERWHTEQQLRHAQRMEAIGSLTGGIAHDFNNLLGVVIGNLDLVRDRVGKDGELAGIVGDALDAALRGADLTQRLLAYARRQPLQPERTDVNQVIIGIGKLLDRALGEKIEVALDLASDVWPVVIDRAQLESSLTNLATNARDAMPKGGRLTIATGNRHLDRDYAARHAEVQPGDYAMISVGDTGTGMPAEVASHIFEPFYTTKEPGKGTGLGLSMVFGFIKQSGGHITTYSELGVGTVFTLYLPRAAAGIGAAEAAAAAPMPLAHGHGETVLAVEDDASLRRVVVRQLDELGYSVLEAGDPAEALKLLEGEAVDILFTDNVMPGGTSGYDLAHLALARWPRLKVLLTSGFTEIETGDAERLPGLRLLTKPYRREELGRVLRQVLDAA